jgi:diguanylate cyclase (GGDEF)-like protein/PAS domain S-box-containing protein
MAHLIITLLSIAAGALSSGLLMLAHTSATSQDWWLILALNTIFGVLLLRRPSGGAVFIAAPSAEPTASHQTVLALDGTIRSASPLSSALLGYPPDALAGMHLHHLLHPSDHAALRAALNDLHGSSGGSLPPAEYRLRHRNGSWRVVEVTLVNAFDDPQVNGCIVHGRDVTEHRELAARLEYVSFHDDLTGLPNRRGFLRQLEQALACRAAQAEAAFAVLIFEIDRFSTINESLGHAAGDQVLQEVSARLLQGAAAGDCVARMGGDEFVVLLGGISQADQALAAARRVQDALGQPFRLSGQEIYISASGGVAIGDDPRQNADSLLREADTAVRQAKTYGLSQAVVFDRATQAGVRARLQLEIDLRGALEREELRLVYQPIMDLPTGETIGMEALLRWNHPQHGMVLPSEFIPLAEDTGLIVPIGLWALEQACRQFQIWHRSGDLTSLRCMSVNLSARQFANPNLVANIKRIIERTGISPRHLELEITETVVMTHAEHTLATLRELKELGIQLAIDDFGTGYSSLSYLHSFPLDTLKVDRSFVSAMHSDHKRSEIVRTIIAMSQHLAMSVIAEGIETTEQATALRDMGCAYGQGYHFARPLEAKHMLSWIQQRGDAHLPFRHAHAS